MSLVLFTVPEISDLPEHVPAQSNQIPVRLGPSILRGKMLRLWVVQWSCWKALQDVRLECAQTEHRGLQKLHLSNVIKCGSWSPLCAVRALDDSGHWC